MRLFKFLVPSDRYYPLPDTPTVTVSGCLALALAETEAGARQIIVERAEENGKDVRWLAVAVVTEIPLDKPRLVAIAF